MSLILKDQLATTIPSPDTGKTAIFSDDTNLYIKAPDGTVTQISNSSAGTVTSVSVVTANGVSGTVATATSTPAITLSLGDITPSSVASAGTVTGSNLSGTNTGDQTLNSLLPLQTGNTDKYLKTDGTNSSWASVTSGTVTSVDFSGGTTGLTASGGPITSSGTITLAGTLAIANGGTGQTTANAALNVLLPSQTGNSGKFLQTDGSVTSWVAGNSGTVTSVSVVTANGVSGTVAAASSTPAITISLGAITPASVAASGTITGSNLSGTNTGDQTITLTGDVTGSGTGTVATTLATVPVTKGGTGATTANGGLNALLPGQTSNSGKFLKTDGTNSSWASVTSGTVTSVSGSGGTTGLTMSGGPITSSGTLTLGGTLTVSSGGTGATTLTGYVKGSGTSAFSAATTIPGADISGVVTPKIASVTATSTTAAIDFTSVDVVRLTLQSSVSTLTISGALDGQKIILEIIQDATGSRTITWPANVRFGTDIASITLSTAPNKKDRIGFIYDASAGKYDVMALARGY